MDSKAFIRSSGWRKAFLHKSTNAETTPQRQSPYTQSNTEKKEVRTLESTYGRPNKVLSNEGAGGAILLVTRRRDGITFAVKRYTPRQHHEDEREYTRKIAAEFGIGARLRHTNIIKTLDLFNENHSWLQVMEYAPRCLFDLVMSRQMSTDEINCTFMQILAGTNHLHRSGFAHRDLKLENVVITDNGIMKLIDFGSAILCKEPGRRNATGKAPPYSTSYLASADSSGFVGSISYMSPEAAAALPHDPQKADVWSLAIIYACMVLRRFPWRSPSRANEAFALFAAMESPKTQLAPDPPSRASSTKSVTVINVSISGNADDKNGQNVTEKMLGSWGLLRLLPVESREVVKGMLTINPESRPTLRHVMDMSWVASVRSCTEDVNGRFCPADGHRHGD